MVGLLEGNNRREELYMWEKPWIISFEDTSRIVFNPQDPERFLLIERSGKVGPDSPLPQPMDGPSMAEKWYLGHRELLRTLRDEGRYPAELGFGQVLETDEALMPAPVSSF